MIRPPLFVQRLKLPPESSPLAATMLRLNEASPRPLPFFTPQYMSAYLAHNELYRPKSMDPFLLAVRRREDREIVGVLPLKRVWDTSRSIPFRGVEFLVASEVDLPTLLASPEDQSPAAIAIMRHLPWLLHGASSIQLVNQTKDSALFQAREAARGPWSAVHDDPGMPISSIPIAFSDLDAYFKMLNKKMRSNVGRLARKLCAEGQLEYLTSSDLTVVPDLFRVYLDVEARSWKRGTSASLRRHPARVKMYEQLHEAPSGVKHHVDVLLLNGVAIAAQVSMHYGRTVFAMETCYDESHGEVGAGNLLLFLAVGRALRLGARELGLHGHFDYYKHRWLAQSVETRNIHVLRKGSYPHVRAVAGRMLRRLQGREDREIGIPEGQPDAATVGSAPPPGYLQVIARLREHPAMTRLDHAALEALLPFSLSAQ